MDIIWLFVMLLGLLMFGVPVAVALAGSSLIFIFFNGATPPMVVAHRVINGVDSFPLLAVPFFILAGNLMNTAGITERIFNFALALVGWMRGGLGHVNVGASVIFAGMSGAAVADAGGLGAIEIKAMRDAGYDPEFAVGITAASSTIGPIIPPSLPMVIYGVVAGASIGQLFVAGFVPGLLMALSLMVMIAVMARTRGFKRDQPFYWSVLFVTFRRAFLSLMTPVIIVGGILTGAFTPTEAAVAACAWALFLGIVVYRTLNIRRFLRVSFDTIETTAVVLLVVGAASIFAWILTSNRVPEQFAAGILSITDRPWLLLLLINLILLVVGCFMETVAAITIMVPVLLPIATMIGIDPVHFGVIMVLNLMLGLLTPPIGMVLYVLARVAKLPFERCVVGTAPFLIPLTVVLLLVTFVPALTMWLPTLIYR
ncbi:TRAP transporter large permease [Szabonella alba]|uniref:TRAP transporter large permease protein n=1 Tax=Szabonella alba TaxID=2804194 RepID=A0A8K0Y057_9RHOB|nr:TRAP transporter large permease [Szabonella alba]MBL4916758.1 TRAP transporter large permease [Szabonella alba]